MKHQHHCLRAAVVIIGASVMFGCANFQPLPENVTPTAVKLSSESTPGDLQVDDPSTSDKAPLKNGDYAKFKIREIKKAPILQIGTQQEQITGLKLPEEQVSLNADGLPLQHFINLALGDILKLNYLIDSDLEKKKNKITLRVNEPVTSKRLLGLVEEALQVNGVALAQDGDLIKVIPSSKASSAAPVMMQESVKPLLRYGKVTEIIPVYYIGVNQASTLATKLFREGRGGSVLIQPHLNSLMVVAAPDDIDKLRELLAQLDVPNSVSEYMSLASPRFLTAINLATQLKVALAAASIPASTSGGTNGVILKVLNTEQLIMTSNSKNWLDYAENWVKRLDIPPKTEAEHKGVYVYYMKNTKAKDSWGVVKTIFGDGKSSTKTPEVVSQNILASSQQQNQRSITSSVQGITPGNTGMKQRQRAATETMSVVSKDYKVVVDDDRNALIFQGTYQDYQQLVDLLSYVDKRPRQVLLKATIAEISLTDAYNLGLDWTDNGNSSDVTGSSSVTPSDASSYLSLTGLFGDFTAKFNALLSNGKVQVLSSPKILALDGESASINIGQQIQVITGSVTGTDSDSTVTNTYSYVSTGVQLDITPSINESGLVQLDISQEVSTAGESSSGSPPINTRSLQTSFLADTGETVYIGGLIKTRNEDTEQKVPVLGDIPLLGNLFKYKSQAQSSTELLLLITPYVIKSQEEALLYTKDFSQMTGWTLSSDMLDNK
ncbi:Putative type II secretion system protein D precursor [Vibrio aerogenes CECT 7868]|uniref:Putative type II secretion system protein D n=2 Tax=Vibrio aerogenes TaxID=92172 RepID=A0A1M5ZCJ7_9VIBR|nr:Putative type II secretion system protein D precursor [Vibrio aerogenes CECT 7868]